MKPVPANQQRALVDRLMKACGGAYSPRRAASISSPDRNGRPLTRGKRYSTRPRAIRSASKT